VFEQVRDLPGTPDHKLGLEFAAHRGERVDFFLHNRFGQTKLGNPVDHDTAGLVKSFEQRNAVPLAPHIGGDGESRRAGADDANLFAGLGFHGGRFRALGTASPAGRRDRRQREAGCFP